MKNIIDRPKLARRALAANVASVGGLITLLASVVLPLFWAEVASMATLLMIVGLGVSMVGIFFANRWIRKPRPEDSLAKALKGLTDAHRLYHYSGLPSEHILLAPNGVVSLEVINLDGQFSYRDGRWKEKMSISRALRYIVEQHLGNPVRDAQDCEQYLRKQIYARLPEGASVPVNSIVVFTHPAVQLDLESTPVPVCKVDKLRKSLNSKSIKLKPEIYAAIQQYLDERYPASALPAENGPN